MSERESILGRIREALKSPAPLPGSHPHDHPAPASGAAAEQDFSRWLPAVGASFKEQLELFRSNSKDLRTDFRLLDSSAHVVTELAAICAEEKWKKFAFHRGELVQQAAAVLPIPGIATDEGYDVNALESCDAGISECDALVAQTGTVVVTSRSCGGRALSVLPPHHVVIARCEQLLPDLPAAFAMLKKRYADNYPSMISFVTGPSRTGDIERILVLGAHGPKKLTVLCF